MRAVVLALALLVGASSADAKEADLVRLRDPAPKAAAKPASKKSSPTRAKKKQPQARKAKARPSPKKTKKSKPKKSKPRTEEVRLRPMP